MPDTLRNIQVGGTYSIDISNKESLERLVSDAQDELDSITSQEERMYLNTFFNNLRSKSEISVTYGRNSIQKALQYNSIDILLISDNYCPEIIDDMKNQVESQGGEIQIISTDYNKGKQFENGFDGIGAILRFPIN